MISSFRSIAAIMDPVDPPVSLKALAAYHRWVGNGLPQTVSFRAIAHRHNEPANATRFLSYNTFLLEGMEIPLNSMDLVGLINKIKWDIANLYVALEITCALIYTMWPALVISLLVDSGWTTQALSDFLGTTAKILGYIDDCLNDTTFGLWGEIKSWADVTFDMVIETAGDVNLLGQIVSVPDLLNWVMSQLGIDVTTLLMNLGFQPIDILRKGLGIEIPDALHVGAKPEVAQRAIEIGQVLGGTLDITDGHHDNIPLPYSIMALCEVWTEPSRTSIWNALGGESAGYTFWPGPNATGNALGGSGLFQIIKNHGVITTDQIVFSSKGDSYGDADYWASKGVLFTRIDVGCGCIDLFSTHLFWGGELLGDLITSLETSDEAKALVRAQELDEFLVFFQKWHPSNSTNVAIVTGDFNISSNSYEVYPSLGQRWGYADFPISEYQNLTMVMDLIDLRDQWTEWTCQSNGIPAPVWKGSPGRTDGSWDQFQPFADIIFCRDPQPRTNGCPRYDHIFIEKPKPGHSFNLDITRIRRRHFLRAGGGHEIATLSDHMGLDATLILSSRPIG